MKLVFSWIQWCWKWTQARILVEKFGFNLFETGTTLREMALEDSPLWKLVKKTIEAWKQVSPEIVEDILKNILEKNKKWNLIFDWFVRNQWNKDTFDKIVWDYNVVFFDLPESEAKTRLLWRMYDPLSWETFVSWTINNPKTWTPLIKRADDEEKAIQQRIDLFYNVTMPIVEQYRINWNIIEVNANQSIEDVNKELVKKLWI